MLDVSNNNINRRIFMIMAVGSQEVTTIKSLERFVNYSVIEFDNSTPSTPEIHI